MERLPREIILQIVSNVTNIYDIKTLLDVYCNNEELVFNINYYVGHLDIMKHDSNVSDIEKFRNTYPGAVVDIIVE